MKVYIILIHSCNTYMYMYIRRSLTVFLSDGRELPTLHFHDGGSTGLLHALQRYVFLNRYTWCMYIHVHVCWGGGRERVEGGWEKEREGGGGRVRRGGGEEKWSCRCTMKATMWVFYVTCEVESLHKLCEYTKFGPCKTCIHAVNATW